MNTKTVETEVTSANIPHCNALFTVTWHVLRVPPGHASLISDYRAYYCRLHLHVHTLLSSSTCLFYALLPSPCSSLKITQSRGNAKCILFWFHLKWSEFSSPLCHTAAQHWVPRGVHSCITRLCRLPLTFQMSSLLLFCFIKRARLCPLTLPTTSWTSLTPKCKLSQILAII